MNAFRLYNMAKTILVLILVTLLISCGGGGGGGSSGGNAISPISESPVLELTQFKLVDNQDVQHIGQISGTNISFNLPQSVGNSFRIQFSVSPDVLSVLIDGRVVSNDSSINLIESQVLALDLIGRNETTRGYSIIRHSEPIIPDPVPVQNVITEFSLSADNQSYIGNISGNSISVSIPSSVGSALAVHFTTDGADGVTLDGVPITNGGIIQFNESQAQTLNLLVNGEINNTYTVTRVSPANAITSFFLSDGVESYPGTISGNSIIVGVPSSIPSNLVAHFVTTGSQVKVGNVVQISGETPNTFNQGESVVYSVFSTDNQVREYTVTRLSSNHSINEFSLTSFTGESYIGVISGNTISVPVPLFATAAPMTAKFVFDGARVEVQGTEQFALGTLISVISGQPITYNVIAENGSVRSYSMVTNRTTPGLLTLLSSHIVANLTSISPMVTTTDDKFLYMANGSTVTPFKVNTSNGSLSNLSSVKVESQLFQLRITSDNRYLYAAQTNGVVAMYRIKTGGLTPLSPATIGLATPIVGNLDNFSINGFAVTPDDKHVYFLTNKFTSGVGPISDFLNGGITVCDVESTTGNLVVNNQLTVDLTGVNPSGIVISRDGQFAYVSVNVLGKESNNSIKMYSIATNGGLNPLSPASTTPGSLGLETMVTSFDDNYLYVVNPGSLTISAYERNSATGLLSASSIQTIAIPDVFVRSMVASADSKLYVLEQRSQKLTIYAINGNGTLQVESQFTTGGTSIPRFILLNNNGKFIYISNQKNSEPNTRVDIFGVN
jgi:6-phosphogluconolactonase (cycloisomerase 2 family)